MKTLPEEPTAEMVHAGAEMALKLGDIDMMHFDDRPEHGIIGRGSAAAQIYRAMYAAAPDTSAEAVAWRHRLLMELDQESVAYTNSEDHPFGEAGEDYDDQYVIVTEPLYLHPSPSPDGLESHLTDYFVRLGGHTVDVVNPHTRSSEVGVHLSGTPTVLIRHLADSVKSWLEIG